MRSLLRLDLFYVAINQALISVGSALIVILLARFTDDVTFGELRYIVAVLTILSFLSLPGMGTFINQHANTLRRDDLSRLIFTQFRWGLGAMLGAMGIGFVHMLIGDPEIARALTIGGILSPIANLFLVPGLILAGHRRFALKSIIDCSIISTSVIGALIGMQFFPSLSGIIFWYLGSQLVATLLCFLCLYFLLPKSDSPEPFVVSPEEILYGRRLTYLQIPFSLIPAIEKALVFFILGPVSLALFVIAVLPVEHFKSAFRNLMQFYMLPHLTHQSIRALSHWFATGALFLTFGCLVLVLFILYGMPLLFENFDSAKELSLLLVIGVLPLPIHIITIHWVARRQLEVLSLYAGISVVTNILIVSGGALAFGLAGAIIAKITHEILIATGLVRLDSLDIPAHTS